MPIILTNNKPKTDKYNCPNCNEIVKCYGIHREIGTNIKLFHCVKCGKISEYDNTRHK